jgi:purine-binding chemotaxis protein CheW
MLKNNQVVRFMISNESFGVDIAKVQEIVTVPEITKVPDTPDFLEGIINLRGKIVSVIDLRKRLKLNGHERSKKNRILVTEMNGKVVGLIVDEVSEVLRLNTDLVEPPPDMVSSVGAEYVTGVGKLENKIILLLDLAKVLNPAEMNCVRSGSELHDRREEVGTKLGNIASGS